MKITRTQIRKMLLEIMSSQDPVCKKCGIMVSAVDNEGICSECERLKSDNGDDKTKLELLPAYMSPEKDHGNTVRSHPASVDGRPNQKGLKYT